MDPANYTQLPKSTRYACSFRSRYWFKCLYLLPTETTCSNNGTLYRQWCSSALSHQRRPDPDPVNASLFKEFNQRTRPHVRGLSIHRQYAHGIHIDGSKCSICMIPSLNWSADFVSLFPTLESLLNVAGARGPVIADPFAVYRRESYLGSALFGILGIRRTRVRETGCTSGR